MRKKKPQKQKRYILLPVLSACCLLSGSEYSLVLCATFLLFWFLLLYLDKQGDSDKKSTKNKNAVNNSSHSNDSEALSSAPKINFVFDEPVCRPHHSSPKKFLDLYRLDVRYDKSVVTLSDYAVIDVETTGLDSNSDRIVEIGLIKVSCGAIVDKFSTLVNPERHISSAASSINGIVDEDVFTAPKYIDIADRVSEFLDGLTLVGHNISFDLKFLEGLYACIEKEAQFNYIDSLSYSKFVFPGRYSYKLPDLALDFNLAVSDQHRALSDVVTTMQLFELCKKEVLDREKRAKEERKQKAAANKADRIAKYGSSPLFNVNFVFTGVFDNDRASMEETLQSLGAHVRDKINTNTDYLVAGNIEPLPDWAKERKYDAAVSLVEQGKKIKIISEQDCLLIIEETKKAFSLLM